ncbi:hypothetical protein [Priestia abyssalis]|uniref:hypothetical protein n=1 Tax=Priestia abyssalis TaxID=1221450 RepID=UPI000995090E|nr:hypothetical protein [Priestia abyssalis]
MYKKENYLRFTPGLSLYPAVKMADMNVAMTPNTKMVLTAVFLLYFTFISVRYYKFIIAYEPVCLKEKYGKNLTKSVHDTTNVLADINGIGMSMVRGGS